MLSLLSGCGFKLRTAPTWPEALQPVQVVAEPQSRDFAHLLRRTLAEQGVVLAANAGVQIVVQDERQEQQVQSLDADGRVSEYRLLYDVRLGLKASQEEAVPTDRYHYQRSYAYDPSRALGHQWQEQEMVERMRQQAIEEFMQRVALSQAARAMP